MRVITRLPAVAAVSAAAVLLAGCAASSRQPQARPSTVATTTSPSSLTDLQNQFTQIVQQATPSVV